LRATGRDRTIGCASSRAIGVSRMTRIAIAYVATAVAFCGLDFLWLGFVAKDYYQSQVGALLLDRPNLPVAAAFYALYVAGVVIFAVSPALETGSALRALATGALFGFFAYATYDLTNLATLRGWSAGIAMLDLAWGAFVTGAAAAIGTIAARASG
jgi:uncharacterized membrane protein